MTNMECTCVQMQCQIAERNKYLLHSHVARTGVRDSNCVLHTGFDNAVQLLLPPSNGDISQRE